MQTTNEGMQPAPEAHIIERAAEIRRSAAAGLVAGLAFSCVQLYLQLLTGTPSLASLVQDRAFGALPGAVTSALIDRLQFWAKPLALTSVVLGQTIGVAVLGLLITRLLPRRGTVDRGFALRPAALLAALLWLMPELMLLPAAGLGALGLRAPDGAASALATAAAAVVAGIVLATVDALWSARPAQAPALPDSGGVSRRRLLASGIAVAAAGGAAAALLRTIATIGEQSSGPVESAAGNPAQAGATATADGSFVAPQGISAVITPTPNFYVISKNFVDPTLSAAGWSLQLKGMINNPLRLSYNDLTAMPPVDAFVTLECVSNGVGGDLISNTRWTGVPLAALLDRAGVHTGASWVNFGASDGYTESLPLDVARLPTTLLAHSMDGAPLPSKHGFPVRVVTAGNYGMKNPKWLTSIELATQPAQGYWEHEGWDVREGVRTMARFDTRPRQATAGSAVPLGGVAFAGDRSISKVEISTDGGKTWSQAALERPPSSNTWVRWSWQWTPSQAGRAVLAVRAVDGKGMAQMAQGQGSYPSGATGYHTIQVQVAAPAN